MRILALNIQNYQDEVAPWHERRDRICLLIKSLNPDVIALQAVRYDPAVEPVHQAEQLQQQLTDYPHSFWQGTTPHSTSSWAGSAVLSWLPFADSPKVFLLAADTTGTDPTVRLVMHTALEQAGGLLHLFNAHFSYSQPAFAANIAEALPFLTSFSGPKLLVGDFNATPDAEPLQNLRDAGWKDQWQRFHPDEPGYTFQSFQPQIRIDYVWADATVEPWVKTLERVADGGVNERVSDHFGLLVTLDLS